MRQELDRQNESVLRVAREKEALMREKAGRLVQVAALERENRGLVEELAGLRWVAAGGWRNWAAPEEVTKVPGVCKHVVAWQAPSSSWCILSEQERPSTGLALLSPFSRGSYQNRILQGSSSFGHYICQRPFLSCGSGPAA